MHEAQQLEMLLLEPSVRKDRARVSELLAEGFREVGRSGCAYNKQEILDLLDQEPEFAPPEVSNFEATVIARGVVLVTYKASRNGQQQTWRSSLWVCRNRRWQMVFHQGTPTGGQASRI